MLDVLLIPVALLLAMGLRVVRLGEYRRHSHLMTAAFTLIGLRLLLHPGSLPRPHLRIWLPSLAAATATMLLGRQALAWREARSIHSFHLRIHRALGTLTLATVAVAIAAWLLRNHW